jgi:hypothetical protein
MSDWILNLPVLWMSALILGAIYLATAGIYLAVTALAVNERARVFKAISPGMLPPLSVVFALLVGFLAAQVWSDGDRAHTAVNREAGALRAVVILAGAFPGDTEARLRDVVRRHIQEAVSEEWPAMSRHAATLTIIPPRLAESLKVVLALDPQGAGQLIAQRELVQSIEVALDARRQRIILSESSINWVKWVVLLVQAGLMLLAIAMVHSDNRAANRIILAIFATGVGVSVVLIAAHSRPFSGQLAVSPAVLQQVMPEGGASGS